MKKIIFITDGNNLQGLGHVYQSKTLAKYILDSKKKQVEILFLTKSNQDVIDLIEKDSFEVVKFSNDEDIYNYLYNLCPDIIIFDWIDVCPQLAKKIKDNLQAKLVIFTNMSSANEYADIVVAADFGSGLKNEVKYISNKKSYNFFGPKYWILRPEFYDHRRINALTKNNQAKTLMLIFGGADPKDYTSKVLKFITNEKDKSYIINVVIGKAYCNSATLNKIILSNQSNSKINLLSNISNVAELMSKTDLVITSPGLSMFESLFIGTPLLCFYQSEVQRTEYMGVIDTLGIEDIDNISTLINNRQFLFPDSTLIKNMEIGFGRNEIINKILQ